MMLVKWTTNLESAARRLLFKLRPDSAKMGEKMEKRPLAAVTMAFNEEKLLPIWLEYYGRQVGLENCYILNHGSTDDSMSQARGKCAILDLPRTPHSDTHRVALVGKFTASLLNLYESVIYTDTDEFIVADPLFYSGLIDFCNRKTSSVITMFGMDVMHDPDNEPALDPTKPILAQRSWIKPSAFLCKPSLVSREVLWWNGFHGYDGGNILDNIYLFHLANVDIDWLEVRQRKRNISAPIDGGGGHHRYSPANMVADHRRLMATAERITDVELAMGSHQREQFLDNLFDPGADRATSHMKNHTYQMPLWSLPKRFRVVL